MLKEIKEKLVELSAYLQGATHATENDMAESVYHEARHMVIEIWQIVKEWEARNE